MYGQIYPKNVIYAAILSTLHEMNDLKHRSSYFRSDPLIVLSYRSRL